MTLYDFQSLVLNEALLEMNFASQYWCYANEA